MGRKYRDGFATKAEFTTARKDFRRQLKKEKALQFENYLNSLEGVSQKDFWRLVKPYIKKK